MQAFVIISKGVIMINAYMNAKNSLTKAYSIKDLFGIQVITNVNAINYVILVSIYTTKIVSARKN